MVSATKDLIEVCLCVYQKGKARIVTYLERDGTYQDIIKEKMRV